jgi:hypothetical protein
MPADAPPSPGALTDPEDAKLVTLARSTRARTRAAQGACVRDQDGRTYAAATVALPSLRLSAVQVAVAMAVTSGARGLEAVVVLGEPESGSQDGSPDGSQGGSTALPEADLAAVRDLAGPGVPVHLTAPDGSLLGSVRS